MSTRSNIIAKTKDGYKWIYCHNDGYPEHVGAVLRDYYKREEIEWLFSKGDISSLGLPFKERNWKEDYDAEKCIFYHSRGETGIDVHPVTEDYFREMKDSWIQYYYFFDGNNWIGITDFPECCGTEKEDYEAISLKTMKLEELLEIVLD